MLCYTKCPSVFYTRPSQLVVYYCLPALGGAHLDYPILAAPLPLWNINITGIPHIGSVYVPRSWGTTSRTNFRPLGNACCKRRVTTQVQQGRRSGEGWGVGTEGAAWTSASWLTAPKGRCGPGATKASNISEEHDKFKFFFRNLPVFTVGQKFPQIVHARKAEFYLQAAHLQLLL